MFSKVISFFDRSKKNKKIEHLGKNKNYDKQFMEWNDDEDDHRSVESLSWTGRNALEKSKSDSSITAIRDCNYRTQGIQVSFESCDMPRNVTSVLENLDLNDVEEDDIEDDNRFKSILTNDYYPYNQFDHSLLRYGFNTQDVSTKQAVIQGIEILNFQGKRHSPDEIAPYWKKDCRMWLWKSVRLASRQNKMQSSAIANVQN